MSVEGDEAIEGVADQADATGAHRQALVQAEGQVAGDRAGRDGQPVDPLRQRRVVVGVEEQGALAEPALEHLAERAAGAFRDVDEEQDFRSVRGGRSPGGKVPVAPGARSLAEPRLDGHRSASPQSRSWVTAGVFANVSPMLRV